MEYSGAFKLYLAQFPLFERLEDSNFFGMEEIPLGVISQRLKGHNRQNLLKSAQKVRIPDFLIRKKDKISKINIWASKTATKSKLHFDFYENYLHVLTGKKTVLLFPPDSKLVTNDFCQEFTFHESHLKIAENCLKSTKSRNDNLFKQGMLKVDLYPGDMLHIPEGYHHFVYSEANTLAVNFWCQSIFTKIFKNESNISRRLVLRSVKNQIQRTSNIISDKVIGSQVGIHNIKKTMIDLLLSKKLDIKRILSSTDMRPKLFLMSLLDKLEESDSKINYKQFEFIDSIGKNRPQLEKEIIGHTTKSKEYFYEVFGIYVDEETRIALINLKKEIYRAYYCGPVINILQNFEEKKSHTK